MKILGPHFRDIWSTDIWLTDIWSTEIGLTDIWSTNIWLTTIQSTQKVKQNISQPNDLTMALSIRPCHNKMSVGQLVFGEKIWHKNVQFNSRFFPMFFLNNRQLPCFIYFFDRVASLYNLLPLVSCEIISAQLACSQKVET